MRTALEDVAQDEDVQYADDPQKDARDRGSQRGSRAAQRRQLLLRDRRGGDRREREREHDGCMRERKEEADPEWPLALLHQVANGVVDRSDNATTMRRDSARNA